MSKTAVSIIFAMAIGVGALTLCYTSNADSPSTSSTQRPAVLDSLIKSVSAASAFHYIAEITEATGNDPTHPGPPLISDVRFAGQDPNEMRLVVLHQGHPAAIVVSNSDGVIYYDYTRNKYLKVGPLTTDADWQQLHATLDKLTGTPEIGNLFDSTMIHNPMLDLAENYDNVGGVTYEVHQPDHNGNGKIDVAQSASTSAATVTEHVYIGPDNTLSSYSVGVVLGGVEHVLMNQQFRSLELLQQPLPSSTFVFKLPQGAHSF